MLIIMMKMTVLIMIKKEADSNGVILIQESPRVPEGDEAVVGYVPLSTERTER